MSKNRKLIEKALSNKGLAIDYIEWEPIRNGGIMCGCEGGWTVWIDTDKTPIVDTCQNPVLGYNINEVLLNIEKVSTSLNQTPNQ